MRQKAAEPRVLMKVAVSDRDWILRRAREKDCTGIEVIKTLVKEARDAPSKQQPRTITPCGGHE